MHFLFCFGVVDGVGRALVGRFVGGGGGTALDLLLVLGDDVVIVGTLPAPHERQHDGCDESPGDRLGPLLAYRWREEVDQQPDHNCAPKIR